MLSEELKNEINKWSEKLDEKIPKLIAKDEKGKQLLENAKAYRKDSKHFHEENKLIESFESLIWAWALIETGEDLNHLESLEEKS